MKKMALRISVLLLILAVPAIWGHADEIKIGAGAAPTENVLKPVEKAFEKASGHDLVIISSGPKNALIDLERGVVDAAAAGLSMQDWLALMKKEGAEVKDPAALQTMVIGKDRIVLLVNKENPVTKLSKEQLQGIFSGATDNWKQVGGADSPILVVWGKLTPGTNSMFAGKMMDGKPVTKDVIDATTAEDIRQNVASNPSAVGIGPLAVVDGSVKTVEIPEISRDITLATKGKPSAKVQALLDFIKGPGKSLIK